ncbi:2-amino-4-hydroxy-6-hydroxymethyldihydropteridine diphosphokinase [Ornithinimicrobium sp. Y1694]|uniref:2-amino-4-hydroxy-6- hydroxymethyldihydropteridine diphosphokinase n=1 Tax=Ornithinimicrobium sp. Y1694 TaxID=3418590 RepID=UPI003CEBD313
MSDLIRLLGVSARGRHGVLDAEKRDGQDFVVDVVMEVDLAPAGRTDELDRTVNYAEVAADVVEVITGEPYDLIEKVAAVIADRVLARPLIAAVEVTVHKPQAPVGVPFGDVQVVVRRGRDAPVVIALGANLPTGDGIAPGATLLAAAERLRELPGLTEVSLSPIFGSAPVGGPEQPDYVNAVATARTTLAPSALLAALHGIEADFGRVREVRWGARTLDLDLVQYGDPRPDAPATSAVVTSDHPHLMLPHPRAHERAFVLRPWLALDPEATLRLGERSVAVRDAIRDVADQEIHELEGGA